MTHEELDLFLERTPWVEWAQDDNGNFYFRHTQFDKDEKVKVEPRALAELTPEKLERVLVAGRNVDHITRVTGYFSKVSGWNKGKKGELADRDRVRV
ncbi:MAG: anaerobic ribonucleoside-triphosphate reductase [Candidatus Margulisiibacteriota bacterium]